MANDCWPAEAACRRTKSSSSTARTRWTIATTAKPAFARASKSAAAAGAATVDPADTFTVILMAAPPKPILGREVVDHAAVTAQIESLTQPHTGADLSGALALVDEAIKRDKSDRRSAGPNEVYFFTDLQRITWQRFQLRSAESQQNSADQRIASHRQTGRTRRHRPGPATSTEPGHHQPCDIGVSRHGRPRNQLRRHPSTIWPRAALSNASSSCWSMACQSANKRSTLPAGGDAGAFASPIAFNRPANIRSKSEPPATASTSTILAGSSCRFAKRFACCASPAAQGAAQYVADALNPNPAGDSPIRPIIVSEGDLADVELADFDCVFVCNVAQLHVERGGASDALRRSRRRRRVFPRRSRRSPKLQRARERQ